MRRLALLALVSLALVAGCGGGGGGGPKTRSGVAAFPSGTPSEVSDAATEWPAPNADMANTRDASGSRIDSSNVAKLGVAWTAPITATGVFGGYATTPVLANGVVYTQDLDSNVFAYDLKTGRQLWKHMFGSTSEGPNGVALGYGNVYGATAAFAFALDMKTGKLVWRTKPLIRNKREGIDLQPGVFDDTVYVSTVPGNAKGFYKGNGVGVIYALDASNGHERWHFDTVPRTLWSPQHRDVNSGGGLWYTPAFDDGGHVYAAVANPAPWPGTNALPWGSSRPGPNLYTNSLLKLDTSNGKLVWYHQVLPHDIYDWDLHLSPVLAKVNGKNVVVAGGKMGYVYEFDASKGDLLWKKAVGVHNSHDNDNQQVLESGASAAGLKTPETVEPGPLGGVETQMAVDGTTVYAAIVNIPALYSTQEKLTLQFAKGTGEMVALDLATGRVKWDTKFAQPAYGAATLSRDLVFTTTFDGKVLALNKSTGKVVWSKQLPSGTNATVAIAGNTLVTAASVPQKGAQAQMVALRLGAHGTAASGGKPTAGGTTTTPPASGDKGAGGSASAASGKAVFQTNCASCHTLAAANASGTVGPNLDEAHPPAARVKRQVENGGRVMPAFKGRLSPAQIAAVSAYVASAANPNATAPSGGGKGP